MKKLLAIILALVCLVGVVGCSGEGGSDGPITELEFSSYYQSYKYFETTEPLLEQYFESVQKAYNKSDKNDLTTFKLDAAGEAAADALMDKYRSEDSLISKSDNDGRLKFLNMYIPFMGVNTEVAGIELMVTAGDDDGGAFIVVADLEQPETFAELKQKIDDAINEYKTGNGN